MQIYVIDTEIFAEQNIYERVLRILPEERLERIRSVKPEQGKKLSAAAGFLLLYGICRQQEALRAPNEESGSDTDFHSALQFGVGKHGKPALFINGQKLFYNLSHSKTKAACVIADGECGIDIERIEQGRVKDSFIRKVCTDREKELLSQMKEEERKNLFFKLWTGKESVMKWDGRGMAMGPDTIEVSDLLMKDEARWGASTIHSFLLEDYFLSVCCEKDTKIQLLVVDKAAVEQFTCKDL